MAIVTTNANTITGSATNTLGTLGRSVFNSTIGTFADKDTMNQVYKTVEKLNASIETVDKKFDYEAFNGRNKIDDVYAVLASMNIEASWDFMNKSKSLRNRLLNLNKKEKDITLNALGVDVTGESDTVKNEYVKSYNDSEADHNDYYEDYTKTIRQNQLIGDETTTMQLESSNHFNYSGLHNDLYSATQNLYPDDENKGTFANKWIVENRNSLMYKTKKLFNSKKVKTIISRFHTDPNGIPSTLDNAKSKYGLSHGRNLLTKEAESGFNSSYRSGYDDPYCRVWTHHHQYDRYYKTIRPFSTVDSQGNYDGTISVKDFHRWKNFSDKYDTNKMTQGEWGWKKDSNNGWQYSVLQDNGMVNITPKYINGEATNIHTKQCMFSIENLAWRGYDPYSFEQALSWEQRGPLGGRIMWFPPYGITFNETTSTQWGTNTFLGRGEDVYTYTNTTRTGQLSFMMVVDHPSILDYVSWSNDTRHQVSDTDVLRFLAGCGEGDGEDGGGLRNLAKPTPLTDEYIQVHDEVLAKEKPEEPKPAEPPKPTPEETKVVESQLCFYVFYPNNYSGTYDNKWSTDSIDGRSIDGGSTVEAIPYLLTGKGAQKTSGSFNGGTFVNDISLDEDTTDTSHMGNGYEMGTGGLGSEENNYITGTHRFHNYNGKGKRTYWTGLGRSGQPRNQAYSVGPELKKWYYRIDGRYKLPQSTAEEKIHYYNQTLLTKASYADGSDFGLNNSITSVKEYIDDVIENDNDKGFYKLKSDDNANVFTLAEIAYVLYGGFGDKKGKSDVMAGRCNIKDKSRTDKLKEIFSNMEKNGGLISIHAEGFASAQGYVETNKALGLNRARTAAWWVRHLLNDHYGMTSNAEAKALENSIGNKDTTDKENGNGWTYATDNGEDKINAKKWRYAKVLIKYQTTEKVTVPQSNNTGEGNKEVDGSSNSEKITANIRMTGSTDDNWTISESVSGFGQTVEKEVTKPKNSYKFPLSIKEITDKDGKSLYSELETKLKAERITIEEFKDETDSYYISTIEPTIVSSIQYSGTAKVKSNDKKRINLKGAITVTKGDGTEKKGSIEADILVVRNKDLCNIIFQISENFDDVNFKSNKETEKYDGKDDPKDFNHSVIKKYLETYHKENLHDQDYKISNEEHKENDEDDNKKNEVDNKGGKQYVGFSPLNEKYTDKDGNQYDIYVDANGKKWYLKDGKFISLAYANEELSEPKARYGNGATDENRLRYDQEYHFFKVLQQTDPVVFGSLMDKLQYFDPAFHSMTPEGFNGRLTFLQQCMRQGNTVSASDGKFAKSANNLAFGRAPYCVLRLGDFYNQMIVINNLSISYDPLVWDLNVEGAGVQPLIAHVQLSFTFVGGGDMTGPVRRLQNAMSFNYYANARLYDNRADRIERKWSDKTNGALEHDEILSEKDLKYEFKDVNGNYVKNGESVYTKGKTKDDISKFYTTQMYQ